jgi:bifunctional DNase/RNase
MAPYSDLYRRKEWIYPEKITTYNGTYTSTLFLYDIISPKASSNPSSSVALAQAM